MREQSKAKLVRMFVGESDRHDGRALHEHIVERARRLGIAGATVLRGISGYGAHSRLHMSRILRLSEDLPIVIEIVDHEERVLPFLKELDDLIVEGLVTIEDVEVIAYRARQV